MFKNKLWGNTTCLGHVPGDFSRRGNERVAQTNKYTETFGFEHPYSTCLLCIWCVCLVAVTCNLWEVKPRWAQTWQASVHHSFIFILLNLRAFNVPICRVKRRELWVKVCWEIGNENISVGNAAISPTQIQQKSPLPRDQITQRQCRLARIYFLFHHHCYAG